MVEDVKSRPDDTRTFSLEARSLAPSHAAVRKCVIVASHPRSGTHLTIDFIRRNFPKLNTDLRIWQSAGGLYWNLDNTSSTGPGGRFPITRGGHVIAKTHKGGVCFDIDHVIERCGTANVLCIYPFRLFSRTIKGFAEFMSFRGSISEFVETEDRFFGLDRSVADCVTYHAKTWLQNTAQRTIFLNIDNLIRDPIRAAAALEAQLDEPAVELDRRLPHSKRWKGGKISELYERMTGRESTAVVVYRSAVSWHGEAERRQIDRRFEDIWAALQSRQIN